MFFNQGKTMNKQKQKDLLNFQLDHQPKSIWKGIFKMVIWIALGLASALIITAISLGVYL